MYEVKDIDAALLLVGDDGDSVGRILTGGDERRQKHSRSEEEERCGGNRNAHSQLWPPTMVRFFPARRRVRDNCLVGGG